MNCRKITSLLVDYYEGSLSSEDRKLVEDHLKVCSHCRKELKEMESLFEVLNQEKTEKMDENFWINFVPEIRGRIEQTSPRRVIWNLFPRLGSLLGSVVVIILVGIILFSRDYNFQISGVSDLAETETYSLYEFENTTDQLAGILSLAEGTEGLSDLISPDDKQSILALEEIIDDQYWKKAELEDLLDDLSSEELNLLEEKIENMII
jgi:hypothetical protein